MQVGAVPYGVAVDDDQRDGGVVVLVEGDDGPLVAAEVGCEVRAERVVEGKGEDGATLGSGPGGGTPGLGGPGGRD